MVRQKRKPVKRAVRWRSPQQPYRKTDLDELLRAARAVATLVTAEGTWRSTTERSALLIELRKTAAACTRLHELLAPGLHELLAPDGPSFDGMDKGGNMEAIKGEGATDAEALEQALGTHGVVVSAYPPDHNVAVFPQAPNAPTRVCTVCGWYMICPTHRCRPAASAAATALQQRFPRVRSTKLGYGDGTVTFDFGAEHAITFDVASDGTFAVARGDGAICWPGTYSADDAALMIETLLRLSQTMTDVSCA